MLEVQVGALMVGLRAFHDLSWVTDLGTPFIVFDQLTSGNLCFGIKEPSGRRIFVKYAGAPTLRYAGDPWHAIGRLQRAAPLYGRLAHPLLPDFLGVIDRPHGFANVLEWRPGCPIGPLPDNFEAMRSLPVVDRFRFMDQLIDLQVKAAALDLVPQGMKDENLLVDVAGPRLTLCHIDRYLPMPAINTVGRLSGNTRYLAPEAQRAGTDLDEGVAVYMLGALAHTFLGDPINSAQTAFEGSQALYQLTREAMNPDKKKRPLSVAAFQRRWRQGLLDTRLS